MDVFPFEIPGPAYRERQVRTWIYRRAARSFLQMTDLPLGVRTRLAERYGDVRPEPLALRVADEGATVKALFSPGYEVVAMRYRGASSRACADEEQHVRPGSSDRRTACVSSQAGCGLGCTFCATGQMGLVRSLEPFEIVQQVLWAADVLGGTVTNVVFMGMGEPLANYEASLAAIRSIHDDVGISARKVVLSTVGLVPAMLRLAEEPLPVTLALSLHAPDDETRSRLVPVGVRWPVAECMEAAHAFRGAHGRRVTIEYALIAEVNDHRWQAEMLAGLLRGTDMHVNLIPLNPTAGFPAHASARVEEFAAELKAGGVNVTVRDTRGREIDAACGQLASRAPRKMERAGST